MSLDRDKLYLLSKCFSTTDRDSLERQCGWFRTMDRDTKSRELQSWLRVSAPWTETQLAAFECFRTMDRDASMNLFWMLRTAKETQKEDWFCPVHKFRQRHTPDEILKVSGLWTGRDKLYFNVKYLSIIDWGNAVSQHHGTKALQTEIWMFQEPWIETLPQICSECLGPMMETHYG